MHLIAYFSSFCFQFSSLVKERRFIQSIKNCLFKFQNLVGFEDLRPSPDFRYRLVPFCSLWLGYDPQMLLVPPNCD